MPHILSHKYPIPISQLCLVNTDVPAGVGAPPLDTTAPLTCSSRGFISGTGNSLNRHLLVFLHDTLVNQRHCVCQYQVYWFPLTVPYGIDRPRLPRLYWEYTKQHSSSLTSIWNTCLYLSPSTYHCSPFLLAQNLTPKHVLPGGIN